MLNEYSKNRMMAISEVDGLNKQNEAVLKKSKKLRVK